MTDKQKWLLDRLLIPAGILPPAITYNDLQINEDLRKSLGNAGFEYDFLMDQDADRVRRSAIGKYIKVVHAPFPAFGHASFGKSVFLIQLITNLVYGRNRIPNVFSIVSEKTFAMAKTLGAKIVVFHTYHLDHQHIPENLATLAALEEKFQITPVIEHEGNYMDNWMKNFQDFKKVDGSLDWLIKPDKMITALDRFYPRKKFSICLDTSSLYGYELPILETAEKVWPRVGHLHLAGSIPGIDLAAEIDQPEIIDLVRYFYDKKYSGYILAEINGTAGKLEEIIAQVYGGLALIGIKIPYLKRTGAENASRHIANSCHYLFQNIN